MALHLYLASAPIDTPNPFENLDDDTPTTSLRLLCAYENGSVALRKYTKSGEAQSIEGRGWDTIWEHKRHVETGQSTLLDTFTPLIWLPVMAMAVSNSNTFALTVSADHLVVRYSLSDIKEEEITEPSTYRIKNPGNASVAIRHDGRVCAIGGWDGR